MEWSAEIGTMAYANALRVAYPSYETVLTLFLVASSFKTVSLKTMSQSSLKAMRSIRNEAHSPDEPSVQHHT